MAVNNDLLSQSEILLYQTKDGHARLGCDYKQKQSGEA